MSLKNLSRKELETTFYAKIRAVKTKTVKINMDIERKRRLMDKS